MSTIGIVGVEETFQATWRHSLMNQQRVVEHIGHRGAKRELPENTLPAFQRAFERGATGIELDVHGTRDGRIVVHHDPIARLADGRSAVIAETDWPALQSAELAAGGTIPTLANVLAIAPLGTTVYVEIKGEHIEAAVADVIRDSPARCAVHSFNHDAIVTMRRIAPEIPRGILFDEPLPDLQTLLELTGARDVWPHWPLIDRGLVDAVEDAGGRVIAWTVNDRDVARTLTSLGVDGLCGDDVRLFEDTSVTPPALIPPSGGDQPGDSGAPLVAEA